MAACVYCIAKSDGQAIRIANRLRNSGFTANDISILSPDRGSGRDIAAVNSTKAPEGATAGVGAGAMLGGAVGWLAGIGAFAVPGLGPLIAAGPMMTALSGAAIGGAMGGLTGALVGMGIPEYEAQQYEGRLREGGILMCVHAESSDEVARIRQIYLEEEAEDISTGSEATVPKISD